MKMKLEKLSVKSFKTIDQSEVKGGSIFNVKTSPENCFSFFAACNVQAPISLERREC